MQRSKGFAPNFLDSRLSSAKGLGFTLVELLVAMSIFAVIAVVLYACFRGGIVSYKRISEEADSQQRLRYVLLRMEKDLKNAFLMTMVPFIGNERAVSFTSVIMDKENVPLGAGRISYYIKQADNAYILVRKTESLMEASAFVAVGYDAEAESPVSGKEEIIVEGVSSIRFTYLHAEGHRSILVVGEETEDSYVSYEWVDLWEEQGLPVAVRIEILFSELSGIKPRQIVKRVWIPVAMPLRATALEAGV